MGPLTPPGASERSSHALSFTEKSRMRIRLHFANKTVNVLWFFMGQSATTRLSARLRSRRENHRLFLLGNFTKPSRSRLEVAPPGGNTHALACSIDSIFFSRSRLV